MIIALEMNVTSLGHARSSLADGLAMPKGWRLVQVPSTADHCMHRVTQVFRFASAHAQQLAWQLLCNCASDRSNWSPCIMVPHYASPADRHAQSCPERMIDASRSLSHAQHVQS